MRPTRATTDLSLAVALRRIDHAELRLCRTLNRSSAVSPVRTLFRVVSRLGDGWFWYALMLALPLVYGPAAWAVSAQMAVTGLAGLALYKLIKQHAVRERPFITHAIIDCAAAPLDRYSFPSGHTLHAVAFTLLACHHFPEWTAPLAAFASLVALSRVVLGLHYPSDVAAGALLGGGLALTALKLYPGVGI